MGTAKLTRRFVDAVTPTARDAFYWDESLRGFGLKVTPSGSMTYVVQYRMGGRGSATRRFTIGRHTTWSPASARAEAERLLRLAASGTDPQAAAQIRIKAEQELGFSGYAERFLAEYGKRHWRARTYASAESNMRRWISPVLGRKPLPLISRVDLAEVMDRLPDGSPALPRNLFALLRKLFSWALQRGDIERSPFDQLKSPPAVASRDRVLSDEELRFVTLYAGDLGKPFGHLIRLLIVTGQRRDEVAGMSWSELDRPNAEWMIPATRAKNGRAHLVPLSRLALIELDQLAGGGRWPRTGLVFTTTGATPVSGYSRVKRKLDGIVSGALGYEIADWRFHDLRRTFATNLQRLNVRFEITEALLNHVSGSKSGVAGVYQRHDWTDEKRDALESWADRISTLVFEPEELTRAKKR